MPSNLTYPGVYVEELASGARAIAGVSTSIAAFVGTTKRGPINSAVRLFSFADYERRFGGLHAASEVSYAVRQFFLNGGTQAWVVRVVGAATAASVVLNDEKSHPAWKLTAREEGTSGNNLIVEVDLDPKLPPGNFNLTVRTKTDPDMVAEDVRSETFENLSVDPEDLRYAPDFINATSELVEAEKQGDGKTPKSKAQSGKIESSAEFDATKIEFTKDRFLRVKLDDDALVQVTVPAKTPSTGDDIAAAIQAAVRKVKPASPTYKNFSCVATGPAAEKVKLTLTSGSVGSTSKVSVLEGIAEEGNDSLADALNLKGVKSTDGTDEVFKDGTELPITTANIASAYVGDRAGRKGLYALEAVDLFNLLSLPEISKTPMRPEAASGIMAAAASYCAERRAFYLIDPPDTAGTIEKMEVYATGTLLPKVKNAAVFYPWPKISDPVKGGRLRSVAPSGTVAGLFARTDGSRGVWKAPAGTEATLIGVQELAYKMTDLENGVLNPRGVNCLRILPVFGPVLWGSRTTRGDDNFADEWKYIPVRRLALFLEESLFRGTKWAVFEPNDEPLWAQLRLNIGAFMQDLFRQGAFQGSSPRDAYFVKVDSTTTTQTDIDLGRVNIHVGFAPLKPAEFVILKFQQKAGQTAAA